MWKGIISNQATPDANLVYKVTLSANGTLNAMRFPVQTGIDYSAGSGIDITGATISVNFDNKTIVTGATTGALETAVGGWKEVETITPWGSTVPVVPTINQNYGPGNDYDGYDTITYNDVLLSTVEANKNYPVNITCTYNQDYTPATPYDFTGSYWHCDGVSMEGTSEAHTSNGRLYLIVDGNIIGDNECNFYGSVYDGQVHIWLGNWSDGSFAIASFSISFVASYQETTYHQIDKNYLPPTSLAEYGGINNRVVGSTASLGLYVSILDSTTIGSNVNRTSSSDTESGYEDQIYLHAKPEGFTYGHGLYYSDGIQSNFNGYYGGGTLTYYEGSIKYTTGASQTQNITITPTQDQEDLIDYLSTTYGESTYEYFENGLIINMGAETYNTLRYLSAPYDDSKPMDEQSWGSSLTDSATRVSFTYTHDTNLYDETYGYFDNWCIRPGGSVISGNVLLLEKRIYQDSQYGTVWQIVTSEPCYGFLWTQGSSYTSYAVCRIDTDMIPVKTVAIPMTHPELLPIDNQTIINDNGVIKAIIPAPPAQAGTYTLQCVNDGSTITYSWV